MWFWRRIEKIGWSDRVRNEVLHRVEEERNILHPIKEERIIGRKYKRTNRSDGKTKKKM